MALQPAPQSSEEPVQKTMQAYRQPACNTEGIPSHHNHTQDIPMFDGQDSSNLEDWFMDIETTADISQAKSCSLTCTLICEATQTGKCWDEIKGILRLKLCNANIHTYTSRFMEIQHKGNEALAYTITSKQQQSNVLLTTTLWQFTFFLMP